MKTTMDAAGRIVLPRKIREAAHLKPGTEIEVRMAGEVIELKPVTRAVEIKKRGHLLVAFPQEPGQPLTQEEVEATQKEIREQGIRRIFKKS